MRKPLQSHPRFEWHKDVSPDMREKQVKEIVRTIRQVVEIKKHDLSSSTICSLADRHEKNAWLSEKSVSGYNTKIDKIIEKINAGKIITSEDDKDPISISFFPLSTDSTAEINDKLSVMSL